MHFELASVATICHISDQYVGKFGNEFSHYRVFIIGENSLTRVFLFAATRAQKSLYKWPLKTDQSDYGKLMDVLLFYFCIVKKFTLQ